MDENIVINKQKVILARYLPDGFVEHVHREITRYPLDFKIVKPRKTKLGDFRYGPALKRPQITINGNLNPYSFLITTIHELAHFHIYLKVKSRVNPHGAEWQSVYRKMLLEAMEIAFIPKDIEIAVMSSLINVKASSCTDINLFRTLKKYDLNSHEKTLLEQLNGNIQFRLNGKLFLKGELRRKRYLCTEVTTQKKYLVSAMAEVDLV